MSKGIPDPDYILRGQTSPVTAIRFYTDSPGLQYLLAGNQQGVVHIWDLKKRQLVQSWEGHNNHSVLTIRVLEGNMVISQGRDGFLHLWKVQRDGTVQPDGCIPHDSHGFCPVVTTKLNNQDVILTPSQSASVIDILNINNKNKISSLIPDTGRTENGMCMSITHPTNDNHVIIGYEDGSIKVWDLNSGKECSNYQIFSDSVMALSYNELINLGVAGSVTDTLKLFKINKDEMKIELLDTEVKVTNPGINCIEIRSDGKLFATGGWDNQARLFSCKKLKPLAVLSFHTQSIQCLTFHEDNTLAIGSKDGAISVWSLYK